MLLALAACGGQGDGEAQRRARASDTAAAAEPSRDDARVPLAVTIDDLPWVGPLPPGETRVEAMRRVLGALVSHDVRATGFVNCGRLQAGAPVLRLWLEAGQELGNHSELHADLNRADLAAWLDDVRTCHRYLRELTGERSVPFRYPYLHQGPTRERHRAAHALLAELGSPIAHVSIDTGEWVLNNPYGAALSADDDARVERLAEAYVAHLVRAAEHYRDYARERFGRDVAHVLLLHANALAADNLDDALSALERAGFRFVPLAEALADSLYALEDDYIGRVGLSWLYRAAPADPEAEAWDEAEEVRLRQLARE